MPAQPIRFVLAGGLATASHWGSMALMVSLGSQPTTATAIGSLIGAMINYILQRSITFRVNTPHLSTILRYLGIIAITWLANLMLFLTFFQLSNLSVLQAQVITTAIVAGMNYILFKRLVFNARS